MDTTTVAVLVLLDEAETLGTDRCGRCGHLRALHNEHCCSFCTVGDCPCQGGY